MIQGYKLLIFIVFSGLLFGCDSNESGQARNLCVSGAFCGTIELGQEKSFEPWVVKLWKAGSATPLVIDSNYATNGQFILTPEQGSYSSSDTLYITANNQAASLLNKVILATTLGQSPTASNTLVINEITTVATAYTFAQFWYDEGPDQEPSIGTSTEHGTGDMAYDLKVGIPNARQCGATLPPLKAKPALYCITGRM
ncbi:hypothetical protein [Shewanella surugensis]|uniref:Uncharacterized protein n=1 Tax=Shewanella surugensis TaxID=212020 RepID=A0ABT0LA70_9GAMM|nr:hypothetical protein [Shewanella surugensis]MCL1124558.1 hypothetical protein [Shewanella surugensis]